MFAKKAPTLSDLHESAHELGKHAVGVFHEIVNDLHDAATVHDNVAEQAQKQIDELRELRDAADAAAAEKLRVAAAIRNIFGGE